MNKITDDFDCFIDTISLNKSKIDEIISKHNNLTDMIKANPPEGYIIKRTRLSGSYAKHTVLNEYDESKRPDVDVIVIIDSNTDDVYKINKDFFTYFKEKKSDVVSNIRQQSNSIRLMYKNINVDIVIARENQNRVLEIASNKKGEWIESNALKQVDYMKEKKYEGFSYYSLMKLFKYLNKEIFEISLSSYTLEQFVHMCSPKKGTFLRLHQAFHETLEKISQITSIDEIVDCCDKTKPGYDEKDVAIFKTVSQNFKDLYSKSVEAMNGDRKKWEEIFGNRFPKQTDKVLKNSGTYDKTQTPWCN